MVFIAIFKTQIGLLGVKTRFSPTFSAFLKQKAYILVHFFLKKNDTIKDFGLGFRLEEQTKINSTESFESNRLTKICSLESCDLENFLRKVVFLTHRRINVRSCLSRLIT